MLGLRRLWAKSIDLASYSWTNHINTIQIMKQLKNAIVPFSLILLFVASVAYTQNCLPTGITLDEQSDIDNFATNYPDCNHIEGGVRIEPSSSGSITNLNGLSQLTSIGGSLVIFNNAELTDLTGLNNLTSIGGDLETIGGGVSNSTFTSCAGLENLQSVGGSLRIRGIYENFTTLNGLNNLSSVGGDVLIVSDALTDISALSSLTAVNGSLRIFFIDVLPNLDGLENIESIAGDLFIAIGPMLTNIDGLSSLTTVGGLVQIRNNFVLQDLDGLSSLTSVGGELDISLVGSLNSVQGLANLTSINGRLRVSNTALTSLSGLENIDPTGITDLEMENNPSLTLCEVQSICDYLDIPANTATINNNDTDCNSRAEVENACLIAVPVELMAFSGAVREKGVDLKWATVTETNNLGFELYRSQDGNDWRKVDFIAGAGTSDERRDYYFRDNRPHAGLNYYRLKQMDFDGAFQYSSVVAVQYALEDKDIMLFPNPTAGAVRIQIENPFYHVNRVVITDPFGRMVWEDASVADELLWQKEVELNGRGVYTVHAYSGTEKMSRRLVVLQND